MFIVSYVVVTVKARLIDFDRHLEEAAMDLGADEWTTFRKITLPLIAPAILSAALLGFALSIDDFVITYFIAGPTTTFPLFVWGAARVAVPPQVNVIASAIFMVAVLVMIGNVLWGLRTRRARESMPRAAADAPKRLPTGGRMTDDDRADLQQLAARPPVDALHAHGRLRATAGRPDHRHAATGATSEDSNGKRYLDALAGLFSVNIGYGFGEEIGQAALEQMRELPFYTNWSYAHPRAIELAAELASLAPGDLNRVFFVSGGSEAVESAWKLARQYYPARGEKQAADARRRDARARPRRDRRGLPTRAAPLQGDRAPHRLPRDDDGRALDQRHPRAADAVRAARARGAARPQHEPLPPAARARREEEFTAVPARRPRAGDPRDGAGDRLPRPHGAGPERRRRFTPPVGYWQGVRAICDRYDILLSADEVITGFGRLGHWFGSERYDIRPGHRHLREGPLVLLRPRSAR